MGVVVDELREGQELCPVILVIAAIYPQVLFQGLVDPFRLPVRLGMEGRRAVALNPELLQQLPCELGDELGAPVGYNIGRQPVVLPDMSVV